MAANTRGGGQVRSAISRATPGSVHVHGLDLTEVLGTVNLGDFAFLELFKRLPDERESVLFNAMVVALVEHGLTPSALVARLTILGAPESLQGAVAAGLLGLGNTFVGTIEGAAKICADYLPPRSDDAPRLDDADIRERAARVVADFRGEGRPLPGIGHPVHKPVDPRARRLLEISDQLGFDDSAPRLMSAVSAFSSEARRTVLPLNVTGAIGALSNTLGLPYSAARGLGVMARSIGLVGHLLEEREQPLAATVWTQAERESTENPEVDG